MLMNYQSKRRIKFKLNINKRITKFQIRDKFKCTQSIMMKRIKNYFINKRIKKHKTILRHYMDKSNHNLCYLLRNN